MNIKPKHVAVYVPALNRGGAERVAALLASGFLRAGWRSTLLVDFDADANRALVDQGVDIVVLGRSHGVSVRSLARLLRHGDIDVVLAIGGAADVKLSLARLMSGSRARIVLSYHGRSDVGRGRLGHAAYSFAPVLARQAAAVVCVSDELCAHLRDDWRVPPARLTRIYNPVAVEKALPVTRRDIENRPPTIVSMGRLVPEKRFTALIEAVARMRNEARLVIFGEGPGRRDLLTRASDLGLDGRVELPGYRDDPWPCYAQGRCFALTSPREAFGNVIVEALASGLPVVATRSGGPDEILAEGRFGALVNNGDIDGLAEALDRALEQPGDPAPRVARAREFETGIAVQHYLELFNSVLAPAAP
jgi:glycosyltransferase involved in cell wall biosynthesis